MNFLKIINDAYRSPSVQEVVFPCWHEPFSASSKFEWKYARVVQMKLILVGFCTMEYFHVWIFHPYSQPLPSRTITKGKYLGGEIMLLKLTTFSQIPRTNSVVQSTRPQFAPICRNVDTTCSISVTLKLSHQSLIVEIPDGNITITAAAEAHLNRK